MTNTFIAGPAIVDIMIGNQIIATSKTMLDSSITIGSSKEEVRAGAGAKLYGQYFHTSTFGINLTDVMFKLEYVSMQTGSTIVSGADIFEEEQLVVDATGSITVEKATPVAVDTYGIIGWARKVDDLNGIPLVINFTDKTATIPGAAEGDIYCVKYMKFDAVTRKIVVSANFVPDTVRLIMRATLFSGSGGNATKVGIATIEVPRFQFDGNMSISMTSTGVANTPLAGMALANQAVGCDVEDYYATISETLFNADRYSNVMTIAIEGSDDIELAVAETETLNVYAVPYPGSGDAFKALNSELTFDTSDAAVATVVDGVITAVATGSANVTIVVTSKPELQETVIVTVS